MRTPADHHASRKRALEMDAAALARTSRIISTLRLVAFAGAAALGFFRGFGYLPPWSAAVAMLLGVAFVVLVVLHGRLDKVERRAAAAIAYHHWALERIAGRFRGYPEKGERFLSEAHPYASDLEIFGDASLFQAIDSTHTRAGEALLADWLSHGSDAEALLTRQAAVRDLVRRERFRETLAVLGTLLAKEKPDAEPMLRWAEGPPSLSTVRFIRIAAYAWPAMSLAAYLFARAGVLPMFVALSVIGGQYLYALSLLPKIDPVASAVSARAEELARYRDMLELIEGETFDTPLLSEERAVLLRDGRPASREIRALSRIAEFLDARRNEVFKLFIGPFLMWDVHFVLALEHWQERAGKKVRRYVEVISEMEALASLAGFAHGHPEYAWPTIETKAVFRARALGHPLIDPPVRVCNDVALRGPGTALLVTGSNMSGKSTLLRSMGINVVLAMAGAPVVAEELILAPLEVRTSMWAKDSLARGVSHFYAELEKLKRVVDGIGMARPLFFLLDEILQGTNSRERVIGARSVLRHLLEHGALGAVSTHDAGLLDLGPALDARIDKVHLEEQVTDEGGRSIMTFDYRLRPGVVRSTNALRLMKMVGIDVDLE